MNFDVKFNLFLFKILIYFYPQTPKETYIVILTKLLFLCVNTYFS